MFPPPPRFVPSSRFTTPPTRGTYLVFRQRALLVDAGFRLPHDRTLEELALAPVRVQYLGELDDAPCFAAELAQASPAPEGMQFVDLRGLFGRMPEPLLGLASRAVQINDWDRTSQFCGACGAPTLPHATSRSRVCSACGLEQYPRVAPAMIVAVERGDEVLLARGAHFPPGVYSTLAGFVDPGESVEEAVHREVHEEVGVRLDNLRYFASQAWPFPHSLMLGFFADYAGGEITPDASEIEHAAFFHVDALPKLFPGRVSVGNQLLADFCKRRGRRFPSG